MNKLLTTAAILATLLLHSGCSRKEEPVSVAEPRVAIVPFRTSGNAESGQYALLLSNFNNVLAAEFGSRSRWQVVESERLNALEDEQKLEAPPPPPAAAAETVAPAESPTESAEGQAEPAELAPPPAEAVEWAATFPSADYVLLGQIRGFDVGPVDGRAEGESVARRVNRIRSRIDVRIADVRTRTWIASRSVTIDERLPDDSAAETQINRAMDIAARKVVTDVLLAVAREFNVTDATDGKITLSGGAEQGVEAGQTFRAIGAGNTPSSRIEITESFPGYSLARLVDGKVQAGDRVPAVALVAATSNASTVEAPRIAIGHFIPVGVDPKSASASLLSAQLGQDLTARFHQYSGLRVVESDSEAQKALMGQQFLEDLSKGRDPGMPKGSLHGVDYLIFGTFNAFDATPGRREVTQMFGATLVNDYPPQMVFDGRVYILDVNSGEYITNADLSLDVDLRGQTPNRMLAEVARVIGAEAFATTILQIRPLAVVEAREGRVILNHTRAAGLAVGDRFTVMTKGTDRRDPNTRVLMRNVGGREIGTLTIGGFDAGGWAYASADGVEMPPADALLIRQSAEQAEEPSRKINW
jgi:curli biogenesis system outer membrane secretion channel CsgG